jgi:hypothetical protein
VAKETFARIGGVLAIIVIIAGIYLLIVRPHQLTWNATDTELNRPMPGDELDPTPSFLSTRAITIDASPGEIWPWIVQMGWSRAGYYGYDFIENINSPRGILSADSIIPELQQVEVGDTIPISELGVWLMYDVEPDSYLVWTGTDTLSAFTWALYPIDSLSTRLVNRIRWTHHWDDLQLLALDLFTEVADFLAVRKVLHGVKARAEGSTIQSFTANTIEFFAYAMIPLIFLVLLLWLLVRRFTWRNLFTVLGSGVLWLVTWYSSISLFFGYLLLTGVALYWLTPDRVEGMFKRVFNKAE